MIRAVHCDIRAELQSWIDSGDDIRGIIEITEFIHSPACRQTGSKVTKTSKERWTTGKPFIFTTAG
jgi:hypothetical protein